MDPDADIDYTCAVCQDTFTPPVVSLKCLHKFCKACIDSTKNANTGTTKNVVKCPLCNEDSSEKDIRPDTQFTNLVEKHLENSPKQSHVLCACETRRGVYRCADCPMILCDDCKKSHKVTPVTKNHVIERIEDIMSDVKSFLNKMTHEHDTLATRYSAEITQLKERKQRVESEAGSYRKALDSAEESWTQAVKLFFTEKREQLESDYSIVTNTLEERTSLLQGKTIEAEEQLNTLRVLYDYEDFAKEMNASEYIQQLQHNLEPQLHKNIETLAHNECQGEMSSSYRVIDVTVEIERYLDSAGSEIRVPLWHVSRSPTDHGLPGDTANKSSYVPCMKEIADSLSKSTNKAQPICEDNKESDEIGKPEASSVMSGEDNLKKEVNIGSMDDSVGTIENSEQEPATGEFSSLEPTDKCFNDSPKADSASENQTENTEDDIALSKEGITTEKQDEDFSKVMDQDTRKENPKDFSLKGSADVSNNELSRGAYGGKREDEKDTHTHDAEKFGYNNDDKDDFVKQSLYDDADEDDEEDEDEYISSARVQSDLSSAQSMPSTEVQQSVINIEKEIAVKEPVARISVIENELWLLTCDKRGLILVYDPESTEFLRQMTVQCRVEGEIATCNVWAVTQTNDGHIVSGCHGYSQPVASKHDIGLLEILSNGQISKLIFREKVMDVTTDGYDIYGLFEKGEIRQYRKLSDNRWQFISAIDLRANDRDRVLVCDSNLLLSSPYFSALTRIHIKTKTNKIIDVTGEEGQSVSMHLCFVRPDKTIVMVDNNNKELLTTRLHQETEEGMVVLRKERCDFSPLDGALDQRGRMWMIGHKEKNECALYKIG